MASFTRVSSGRKSFGGRPPSRGGSRGGFARGGGRGGDRDRAPAEMHDAVCSQCGANCQVPFKPSGSKPVLCKECFGKQRPESGSRGRGGDRERAPAVTKEMIDAINVKLDLILEILEHKSSEEEEKED